MLVSNPNSLLRRLETVLALIAESFKRKIGRSFFGDRITICFTEWFCLDVVPSALNLTTAMCTAVWEQRHSAAMTLSVYPSPCKVTRCALQTSVTDDFLPIAWM